jgi:hypothetical protein
VAAPNTRAACWCRCCRSGSGTSRAPAGPPEIRTFDCAKRCTSGALALAPSGVA